MKKIRGKSLQEWKEYSEKDIHNIPIRTRKYIIILEELVEQSLLFGVGSSLPKVCTGCGSLNTEVIDKKYLACCPDNNYVPLEEYLKNSRYTKYTKFKR